MFDINISENLGLQNCESRDVKLFAVGATTGILTYSIISNKNTIKSYICSKWDSFKTWVHK